MMSVLRTCRSLSRKELDEQLDDYANEAWPDTTGTRMPRDPQEYVAWTMRALLVLAEIRRREDDELGRKIVHLTVVIAGMTFVMMLLANSRTLSEIKAGPAPLAGSAPSPSTPRRRNLERRASLFSTKPLAQLDNGTPFSAITSLGFIGGDVEDNLVGDQGGSFTPSIATRQRVWRTLYGGDPSPELLKAWSKNIDSDRAECRTLIRSGWDRYQIGDAFARLFEFQYEGRLDASLTEAALDVTENPNPLAQKLRR